MKDIYNLDLFESVFLQSKDFSTSSTKILRVPGGWIITEYENSHHDAGYEARLSSTFVPYSDEFKGKLKTKPLSEPNSI